MNPILLIERICEWSWKQAKKSVPVDVRGGVGWFHWEGSAKILNNAGEPLKWSVKQGLGHRSSEHRETLAEG